MNQTLSFLHSIDPAEIAAVTYGVVSEWPLMEIYSFFSGEVAGEIKGSDQTSGLLEYGR